MFAILLITALVTSNPPEIVKTPVDSLQVDDFLIIEYKVRGLSPYENIEYSQFDIEKDGKILRSTKTDYYAYIYKCYKMKSDCDFVDLNGDGSKDIIFVLTSGGTAGYQDIFIYSLDSDAKVLAAFEEMGYFLAFLKDIDHDGNIELFFKNITNYKDYPEGTETFPNYRVYKWDGKLFRCANILLKNEISRMIFGQIPDSIHVEDFDRFKIPDTYHYQPRWTPDNPIGLITAITALYFICEYSLADSIFERCWPDSISGKEEFWGTLKRGINRKLNKEILESDWK